MATAQLQQPEGLITQADALLKLLGGTKTTTSPGDTGALQKTFADLQGTDYEAMLKAIFQQAGGQIPGIQQAMGNAIGARSGGNSAVQAALQKLLAQTSTGAMDQVAKLQAQNFATQANVGGNIAQATKGTTQKTGTDVTGGLANAAKLVALLQGAKTLGVDKWIKDLTSTTPEQSVSPAMTTAVNSAFASPTAPLSTAETPMFNLTGAFQPQAAGSAPAPEYQVDYTGIPQVTDPGFQYVDMTGFQQPYQQPEYTPSFEQAPPQMEFPLDTYDETYTFADGGIVRGPQGKAQGYADGGTVRAGGSRRSANPEVDIRDPDTLMAQAAADELRGQFGVQAQALSSPVATVSGSDIANSLSSYGDLQGGSGAGDVGMNTGTNTGGLSGRDVASGIGKLGAVNAISGLTGGNTINSDAMRGLGLIGGLATAQTPEQALGVAAKGALGIANPALGTLAGFAMNPSQVNAVNLATSLNPALGLINAALSLGGTSIGAQALGTPQSVNSITGEVTEATKGLFGGLLGAGGVFGGDPAMSSPVSGWGDVQTTDLGMLGSFGGSDGGGNGDSGGHGAGSSDAGAGDTDGGTSNGNAAAANGGPIRGPGTGTSDSIPARLSDGEFVMSADVVDALGEDFFNQLQQAFHTPVAQQRRVA